MATEAAQLQQHTLETAEAAAAKVAHLEKISSRLQEIDDPRAYHPVDGRPLRARAWEEQPTTRAILAAKEESPPNVDAIIAAMVRLNRAELPQEVGCWALKEIARLDESPGNPTGRQAEILQKGGIDVALLALTQHVKSFCVQYRALQLLVCLAVRGVDRWVPHTARTEAFVDPKILKAIRRGGAMRIGRDALFVHSLGRVQDLGDGRDARYIRSEVRTRHHPPWRPRVSSSLALRQDTHILADWLTLSFPSRNRCVLFCFVFCVLCVRVRLSPTTGSGVGVAVDGPLRRAGPVPRRGAGVLLPFNIRRHA
jgi:hypothetical protein